MTPKRGRWDGKDGEGTTFTFTRAGGTAWFLRKESTRQSIIGTYTEATHTQDYMELDSGSGMRFRLYKDKLLRSTNNQDWEETAKGGWVD